MKTLAFVMLGAAVGLLTSASAIAVRVEHYVLALYFGTLAGMCLGRLVSYAAEVCAGEAQP